MNMDVYKIGRNYLLTPKVLYLSINLSFYTLHQYRGNFITEYFDFTKKEYGVMIGTLLFITFFTNIGIAVMNDKFNQQRKCLLAMLTLSLVFFQLFFVESYINLFRNMFWVNMLFYLMFTTSVPPILDKITLEYLNKIPNTGDMTYGRQRLFGTVGYLVTNWILEMTITTKSGTGNQVKKKYNFEKLKYYQGITTFIAIVLSFFLVKNSKTSKKRSDIMASWKDLVKNSAFLFFIFIIFMNGVTRAAMTLYLTIYLTEIVQLKGYNIPKSIPSYISYPLSLFNENPLATVALFAVFLEIIIMFYSKSITKRFGLYWPLLFAQIFQLFRFVGYYLLNHHSNNAFIYVCLFELLKGINFGLTHTSAVQIATKLCPPHLKTTAQMIYSGTFTGLSTVAGGIIFGHVLDTKVKAKFIDKVYVFDTFFGINALLTMGCIVLFVIKYGMFGNKLSVKVLVDKRVRTNKI